MTAAGCSRHRCFGITTTSVGGRGERLRKSGARSGGPRRLRRRVGSGLAAALVALSACSDQRREPPQLPQSGAMHFGWGSYYDTDIYVGTFFGSDHAIGVRFMPQWERAYEGPLFASVDGPTSSAYSVAMQGEFLNGTSRPVQPHISVRLGNTQALYVIPNAVPATPGFENRTTAPPVSPPVWRQLFAVRRGSAIEIWLDGKHLCRKGQSAANCDLPVGSITPSNWLRLGKRPIDPAAQVQNQFYGLIDDVAVFDHALSAQEIAAFPANGPGIDAGTPGLRAGINFDGPPGGPSGVIRPVSAASGGAEVVEVSTQHVNAADAGKLNPLFGVPLLEFPFPSGEEWQVIQEFASEETHAAGSAFSLDLIYVPPQHPRGQPRTDSSAGDGRPFLAATNGTVVQVQQQFSRVSDPSNFIVVRHGSDSFVGYLHLRQSSSSVAVGDEVVRGDRLGLVSNVGGGGPHLHLAVTDRQETLAGQSSLSKLVTRPFYLIDYCASDDFGRTWNVMRIGIPRLGQWIRRMTASGGC